jgi:uridine kinase
VTRIVAVDGIDGSGKSRFATALVKACVAADIPAMLFHVDDFRRQLDFAGLDADAEASLYYERYFDLDALDRVLAPLAQSTGAGPVAIVEGVFTLRVPTVASAGALVVLNVSAAEARRRILERDRAKARSDDEINHRITRRYFPSRERYRAELGFDARADAIVDNEDWGRPRLVQRVAGRFPPPIERLLDGLAP